MKNAKKFYELLNKEEIQGNIIDLYCTLHKGLLSDGYIKYDIILSVDGDVSGMAYIGNQTRMDVFEGNAIVVATIDKHPEVTDEDLGDITYQYDYNEFVEWILDNAEEDFEDEEEKEDYIYDNATWDNYHEFNLVGYEDAEECAWNNMCNWYDADVIDDIISQVLSELEDLI